jgi:hypothetical protein
MGITYIPGPEGLLAPAAAQIAQGLEQFINPNRQFQRAMQAELAKNPAMIQQLADLESSAPGLLESMGFGNLGASIANVPQSIQAMIQQGSRGAVTEALRDKSNVDIAATKAVTGQTPTEISADRVRKLISEQGVKAMDDPEVAAYVGRASLGYKPGDVASQKFEEATMTKGLQMLSEGPDITISKFLNNEYSPAELNAIFATPMGKALGAQLDVYTNRIRAQAMKDNREETLNKLYQAEAYDLAKRTGEFDLNAALRIVKGDVTPETAGANEKKIFKKLADMEADEKAAVVLKIDNAITTAISRFSTIKKAKGVSEQQASTSRQAIVKQIDNLLQSRAGLGAPAYRVEMKSEDPFFGAPRDMLTFKDPFGNTVPAELALAGVPPAPNAEQTSMVNKAYQDIMKPGVDKAKALKALEAANPVIYGEVLRKMGATHPTVTTTP